MMTRSDGEVSVTLLLNGGHSRTLYLRPRDPLLTALVSSIGEKSYGGGRPARPFNIQLDQGRRSFIFSSTDLVGLVTDPPLQGERETRQPSIDPPIEKSPYLLLDGFLDAALHAELLKFVMVHERDFTAAAGQLPALRDFTAFSGLFRDRVRSLVPQLTIAFGIGEFPVGDVDCVLAAQGDGASLPPASRGGGAEAAAPAISYVFYFHNEPKHFTGGEFRLYNSRFADSRAEGAELAAEIEPKNNSILLFPSHCRHEMLPLRCTSSRFADSRFAVAGSVRRARSA
ncbi:MAG: 2OG-Fe(II) oxygenase [Stellaceae bacterium]